MENNISTDGRYFESCQKDLWQRIFTYEIAYLIEHLKGCRDVLSVGCGPAIIEDELAKHGVYVTGLDVSQEALNRAPDHIRTVVARAEELPFPDSIFDAVIYVVSLQFIENYRMALEKTMHVLRPNGRLIVMLLNPQSDFFKEKLHDPDSYVQNIRHRDLKEIEDATAGFFDYQAEYYLGVKGDAIFDSQNATEAVLYIINGTKKPDKKDKEA